MKKRFLIVLFVMVVLAMASCSQRPNQPTHFICFQQGVEIVNVTTIDGAIISWPVIGGQSIRSWVWDDIDGHHYLTFADNLSCQQTEIDN